jgi:hypothetical protein
VKFNLVYDGLLHSQGTDKSFDEKWKMREYLHPQLAELRSGRPGLKQRARVMPEWGCFWTEMHCLDPGFPNEQLHQHSAWNGVLQAPIEIGGIKFLPLIRESLSLACSLRILFMRQEPAGRVHQGGDLYNRIKEFIGALTVPKGEVDKMLSVYPKPIEPIQCLLENNASITKLSVASTRLLNAPGMEENSVRMVVEVDARITRAKYFNHSFRGGGRSYRGSPASEVAPIL